MAQKVKKIQKEAKKIILSRYLYIASKTYNIKLYFIPINFYIKFTTA